MPEAFPAVAGFLSSLDNSQRERFLGECESRESSYQVWLYACAMGYEGDFSQLEAWLQERYPRLNRREMLEAEAIRLERDITVFRALASGSDKPAEVIRTVAALSKELRGHLAEVDRMTKGIDRRGLILSGADRLLRILEDMFGENEDVLKVIGQGFEVLWTQLNEER